MKIIAAIFFACLSACVHAESSQSISVQPISRNNKPSVTNVLNIYGKCGNSVVAILGVKADGFNWQGDFKVDAAGNPDLQIRNKGKSTSYKFALSDYNTVHCVQTNNGPRLLVGGSCSGSACPDAKSYYIIDIRTEESFPAESSKMNCDANCANQALGIKYLQ